MSKSGHAIIFSFFPTLPSDEYDSAPIENTRVHFWTFPPVSVKVRKSGNSVLHPIYQTLFIQKYLLILNLSIKSISELRFWICSGSSDWSDWLFQVRPSHQIRKNKEGWYLGPNWSSFRRELEIRTNFVTPEFEQIANETSFAFTVLGTNNSFPTFLKRFSKNVFKKSWCAGFERMTSLE